MSTGSTGRNDPCPCGSGKKYKRCCLKTGSPEKAKRSRRLFVAVVVVLALAVLGVIFVSENAGLLIGALGLGVIGLWQWLSAQPPAAGSGSDPGAINFGR